MYDVSVVYQAHRAAYPDMVDQMWVTSWHHYLDSNGVSRGQSFATEEEAVALAETLCTRDGYTIVGMDRVPRYVTPAGGESEEEYIPF